MEGMKSLTETFKDYQAILNEIEDGVGKVDIKGNLTFINNAGCRMWGATREEIIGSNYRSCIGEEGAVLLKKAYNQVYQTGAPGRFIHESIRKDGKRRVVEDSVSVIREHHQKIVGFRTVQRDVTDREEAQQKLAAHRPRQATLFLSSCISHLPDAGRR